MAEKLLLRVGRTAPQLAATLVKISDQSHGNFLRLIVMKALEKLGAPAAPVLQITSSRITRSHFSMEHYKTHTILLSSHGFNKMLTGKTKRND